MPFRFPRSLGLAVASLLLVLLSGCLSGPKLRGIAVQLTELEVRGSGQPALALKVRYLNENLVPVAASETVHRLSLNGSVIGRVKSEEPVGLPQLGESTQTVLLPLDAASLARVRELAQGSSPVSYELETTLLIESGVNDVTSNASGSGTVAITGADR